MVKKRKQKPDFKKFTVECPKGHMPVCKKIRVKKKIQKLVKQLPKQEGDALMKVFQKEIKEERESRDAKQATDKKIAKAKKVVAREGDEQEQQEQSPSLESLKREAIQVGIPFKQRKETFQNLKKKAKNLNEFDRDEFENYLRINFDDDGVRLSKDEKAKRRKELKGAGSTFSRIQGEVKEKRRRRNIDADMNFEREPIKTTYERLRDSIWNNESRIRRLKLELQSGASRGFSSAFINQHVQRLQAENQRLFGDIASLRDNVIQDYNRESKAIAKEQNIERIGRDESNLIDQYMGASTFDMPLRPTDNVSEEIQLQGSGAGLATRAGERSETDEDGLYDVQIDDLMKDYPCYKGTFADDELDSIPVSKKMCWVGNTDTKNGYGKHWYAVYIDGSDCMYYDPFGDEPSDRFVKQLSNLIQKINPERYLKLKINSVKNQDINSTNCGFHAIAFLNKIHNGKDFKTATGYIEPKIDNSKEFEENIEKFKKQKGFGYI